MINYDTIKSVYENKLTLMQWLNKVQEALKDATAVSFNVNKTGDATLTFSIVFDDGTELETDPIILEQGESVESVTLRNGHLILTLTNGDELDAGDVGAVSSFSIDANQHLIVTYQDGSTDDLGAIFNGNVTIGGNLTAAIIQANAGLKSNYVEPTNAGVVTIGDISLSTISSPNSNPIVVYPAIKAFEKIMDSNGHLRFIEGDLRNQTTATTKYGKWALSGSHLLIVMAIANETAADITLGQWTDIFGTLNLPSWIYDKLVGYGSTAIIAHANYTIVNPGSVVRVKSTGGVYSEKRSGDIYCVHTQDITLEPNDYLRVQFDLLIDNA